MLVSVSQQVLSAGSTLAESSWAILVAVGQSDTLALRDKMEVMVARVHTIDFQAVSVLPGVSDLQVAQPGVAVEGTLFLFVVELVDLLPADIVIGLRLNALM